MTSAAASLIAPDEWLAGIIGHPVFRVGAVSPEAGLAAVADLVERHAAGQHQAMYYAKVPTHRTDVLQALGRAGLAPIDVNVTFESTGAPAGLTSSVPVADCTGDQADAVLDIAGSCFRYSRFHLDPHIPDEIAHRIKREWIRSYVRKTRGDALLVATLDGRPAGFLAAMTSKAPGDGWAAIDLVGVAGWAQRRGVGRALVQTFLHRYRDRADRLRVGTQVANVPSVRLYEQCGFSLSASEYVLHRHVGGRA